jgi:integrase
MQDFTDFIHMSPFELLVMVEDEIDRKVKQRNQKIKTYVADYTAYLECELDKEELKKYGVSKRDKKNAPLTIHKKRSAIKSFFKYNDVVLPIQERKDDAKPLEEQKGMPEKEDIRKVLTIADPLERAIILVGCSSGLSVNEITNLKVKDFTNGHNENDGITVLQLRREKTKKTL